MAHVLKRPCSGREKYRKVTTSRPKLSRAVLIKGFVPRDQHFETAFAVLRKNIDLVSIIAPAASW